MAVRPPGCEEDVVDKSPRGDVVGESGELGVVAAVVELWIAMPGRCWPMRDRPRAEGDSDVADNEVPDVGDNEANASSDPRNGVVVVRWLRLLGCAELPERQSSLARVPPLPLLLELASSLSGGCCRQYLLRCSTHRVRSAGVSVHSTKVREGVTILKKHDGAASESATADCDSADESDNCETERST